MGGSPASLRRRLARLALINIAANITVPLASLVDTALLGHLADLRFLAGVALASVLFDYVYWSFGFLRMGTTGTTAQAWGRHDQRAVFHTLYRGLLLALILAAAILVLQMPLREAGFALLGGTSEVEMAGRTYFNARIWAAPAALSNFVLLGWYLGREESAAALAMTIVANVGNIGLDYLFIVRLGLAAFGAGLATTISQYLMLVSGLLLLSSRGPHPRLAWLQILDPGELRAMFRLNRDLLIRTVALITCLAVFTNCSALLGTAILAANAVLQRLVTLAAYLVDGVAFAAESLGGILAGSADRSAFRRLARLAMTFGLVLAAASLTLYLGAPRAVLGLITSHPEALGMALAYLPWLVPVLLLGAIAYVYDGLFLGLTAGRSLRNAMLLSTVVVFAPLALLAVHRDSNQLLWLALSCFMGARALTLWRISRRLFA